MIKKLNKIVIQDLLLRDIEKLKKDLDKANMKLPPGLAGMYGEILAWKELESRFTRNGYEIEFKSGGSKADIVLHKGDKKINIEVKTSRLKKEGYGIGYGFAINLKKCGEHKKYFKHPKRGKIFGDFCYFDFVIAVSLSKNLKPTFYVFSRKFINKHKDKLVNRSALYSSHTHRIIFIKKEKRGGSNEITNFDRKISKSKNKFKNKWYLIKEVHKLS